MNSRSKAPLHMAVATVIAMGLMSTSSVAANAAEPAPNSAASAISERAASAAQAEVDASAVPRDSSLHDGRSVTTYHESHGDEVASKEGAAPNSPEGEFESKISGGTDDGHGHPYILLNSFDQDAIINGSGVLVGFALCGAFPGSCFITSVAIGAAQQYLSYNGKCSDDRQLLLPFFGHEAAWTGINDSWIRCV
ncbi:hypothetical protein JOE38_001311 [Clavibacter michiganensis]|uniref:hypothetical protein n=1 Tax=Clavibacter michiganensis TaxID=28447 RepID=UPI0019594C7B|nr:hypothetical protein [Clavibacter michiganensis]MBM7411488.1 hypothetical protein [Clavibacter michiganensis]